MTVTESSTGDREVQLTVERSPGVFGRVTVNFEVRDYDIMSIVQLNCIVYIYNRFSSTLTDIVLYLFIVLSRHNRDCPITPDILICSCIFYTWDM